MIKKMQIGNQRSPRVYLLCMIVFALASLLLKQYYLAAVEGGICLVMLVYAYIVNRKSEKELEKMLESVIYDADTARNNTLANFPLPIAVFRIEDSRVIWANQMFFDACGWAGMRYDRAITEFLPDFSGKWLLEGKTQHPGLVEMNGKKFRVSGNLIRGDKDEQNHGYMGITYWVDVTDYENIRCEYEWSKPVVSLIVIDNYDELLKNLPDRKRADLRDSIEQIILEWVAGKNGMLLKYDRDRYLFLFEERHMNAIQEEKFSLLEKVHSVTNPAGMHASVSIGVGRDGGGFAENLRFANLGIEMALSRGGDQAVVKNRFNFEFFGGRGSAQESRTKVKTRVMASALRKLIGDSSKVLVMGHKAADLDAVGAAVGVCAAAYELGIESYVVINQVDCPAQPLIDKLKKRRAFDAMFITPREGMVKADSKTLLVLVDTNNPKQAEDEALLQTCNRVAVIDHHRRGAEYVNNAVLTMLEPSASSASELVSELLMEIMKDGSLYSETAEALLAGIMLDTKNFTMRTGDHTFEAAAYLRREGANPTDVKRLLQSDVESNVQKYAIMQQAKAYRGVVIAAPDTPQNRVTAAKAADELLNIAGAEASIVIYPTADGAVFASARSIGELNVQLIMEKLGGGGNRAAAAARMTDISFEDAVKKLYTTIDEYLDD